MCADAMTDDPLTTPFLQCLVALLRAEDSFGVWENRSDADLLAGFVVTKEARRAIPIIGDPSPDSLERMERFYRAVGLAVERRTGLVATPMISMSHEGFGRVVLIAGHLVAYARSLRDVHRFGFETLGALAREGTKAMDQAVEFITLYPALARA